MSRLFSLSGVAGLVAALSISCAKEKPGEQGAAQSAADAKKTEKMAKAAADGLCIYRLPKESTENDSEESDDAKEPTKTPTKKSKLKLNDDEEDDGKKKKTGDLSSNKTQDALPYCDEYFKGKDILEGENKSEPKKSPTAKKPVSIDAETTEGGTSTQTQTDPNLKQTNIDDSVGLRLPPPDVPQVVPAGVIKSVSGTMAFKPKSAYASYAKMSAGGIDMVSLTLMFAEQEISKDSFRKLKEFKCVPCVGDDDPLCKIDRNVNIPASVMVSFIEIAGTSAKMVPTQTVYQVSKEDFPKALQRSLSKFFSAVRSGTAYPASTTDAGKQSAWGKVEMSSILKQPGDKGNVKLDLTFGDGQTLRLDADVETYDQSIDTSKVIQAPTCKEDERMEAVYE